MTRESDIDPVMRRRIGGELEAIEREHGVRIVLAVESGSRAWGFPSRDSDYDVRFLYLRPIEHYLAVMPRRDVIERPVDAALDVSGWDVRKALQLLVRSNAVLIEWLTSPWRYRELPPVPACLLDLARTTADLTTLAYHYDRQARRSFGSVVATDGAVPLKAYCYALRGALALIWLRRRRSAAPMDVPALLAGLSLADEVLDGIGDLLARKRNAAEHDTIRRIGSLDALIADALAKPVQRTGRATRVEAGERADALFASLLLDGSPASASFGRAAERGLS